MKSNFEVIFSITITYMLVLYIVGFISEKLYLKNSKIISNPYVYSLTLAVYCTTWTYYGSVGRASTNGIEFLSIYVGPTLVIFTWWFLLRKIVRISENHNITSIADFISFRYGKSKKLGIVVTLFCLMGIIPYISVQLKAINETMLMLSYNTSDLGTKILLVNDTAFYVSIFIGIFGSFFGTRHFGDQRKHPALVGVIAFESLIKLILFLIGGIFITYYIFDGFLDIFHKVSSSDISLIKDNYIKFSTVRSGNSSVSEWFSLTVMSMCAIMFLPRQFHMAVIENNDEKHIIRAMYIFPLYLFLINLFVIPVAFGGLLMFKGGGNPDYYSLSILLQKDFYFIGVLIFVGGLAAGTGMIIVTSVSLANMFINNLVLPIIVKLVIRVRLGIILVHLKRLSTVLIVMAGYWYFINVGSSFSLVSLGLTSFAAVTQFAPAVIFGIFWKDAGEKGALAGICSGFGVWFYTLIVPYLASSGVIDYSIMYEGLFGLNILKPTALFGLEGLDIWSHSLFWSLFINLSLLIIVSIFSKKTTLEKECAALCIESFHFGIFSRKRSVLEGLTIDDIESVLQNFFGKNFAKQKTDEYLERIGKKRGELTDNETWTFRDMAEKILSGAVGPGASKLIFESYSKVLGRGEEKAIDVFKDLLSYGLGESKETLVRRISELHVILDISRIFANPDSLELKVYKALDIVKTSFGFDFIILRRKINKSLAVYSYSGDVNSSLVTSYVVVDDKTSYIGKSVVMKKPFAVNDIDQITLNEFSVDLKKYGVLCFAHIPLIINGDVHGIISCYSRKTKGLFVKDMVNLLESIANQMAYLINNHYQLEEIISIREISRELEIAKNIQMSLLPNILPFVNGVKMSGVCYPSEFVGGDYYDFIGISDTSFDMIMADVSGHNVASALVMTELRSIVKSILNFSSEMTPAKIMTLINREIYGDLTKLEFIITMVYMRVDMNSMKITFSNAGHYNPFVFNKNGKLEEVKWGEPLIGVIDDYVYSEKSYEIEQGDTVFLFTDGIIETEDESGNFFGIDRLKDVLKTISGDDTSPENIIMNVHKSLIQYRGSKKQSDDITMSCFTVNI